MAAVCGGSLACVQELARVEGVDWETRDGTGKSLLERARMRNKQDIVTFLEERAAGHHEETKETEDQGEYELTVYDKAIPECPVCLERMTGEIYTCKKGHAIWGTCEPRVRNCATCRTGPYFCRNRVLEQTVRAIMQKE